jgi:dihydropteroate synthase
MTPHEWKAPKVFGILNITPDSFSDGGKFLGINDAIKQAELLISEGADIIDVGAESTRPFAQNITQNEELGRLKEIVPELYKLSSSTGTKLSLDSRNYETIKDLIKYIDIINDVSGLVDERITEIAQQENKEVVMMHSLSVPSNPNICIPIDENPVNYLKNWLRVKLRSLESRGFNIKNIIFDPGIGFSKNAKQSLYIIKHLSEFQDIGCKLLLGHSRKSMFRYFEATSSQLELDFYTAMVSLYMSHVGVDYVRIHNVGMTTRLMRNIKSFYELDSFK